MATANYDPSDPRSTLAALVKPKDKPTVAPTDFNGMEYGLFYETKPQETSAGLKTWYTRGQNFCAVYSEADAGTVLERKGQPDEYLLILLDPETSADLTANGEKKSITGYTLTIMPPGDSSVKITKGGRVVRFITERSADIMAKAVNAKSYETRNQSIPPLTNWPDPPAGFKIRSYSIDVPPQEGRIGRIFRCTNFMVNCSRSRIGPRDATKMSPHSHDDFEQCSLVLHGTYVHHVRWPWLTNRHKWRDDEHKACHATSVAFIPPHAIHTSEATDPARNELFDIFCPPRWDFSLKAGSVLNEQDYPHLPKQD